MTVTVSGTIVIARTEPTDEGSAIFLVQGTTPSATDRTAEPRSLPLSTSDTEGPFSLQQDDLGLTVDGNGNLSPAETTDSQYRVIFQKPIVGPFLPTT
jgi:hypothetical protein